MDLQFVNQSGSQGKEELFSVVHRQTGKPFMASNLKPGYRYMWPKHRLLTSGIQTKLLAWEVHVSYKYLECRSLEVEAFCRLPTRNVCPTKITVTVSHLAGKLSGVLLHGWSKYQE